MIEQIKNIDNIHEILKDAVVSYDHYENGNTKYIQDHIDSIVKDVMSYAQWVTLYHSMPVVKIDGLEEQLPIKSDTIHLFLNNDADYSFDWHKDDVDVFLYVVKGKKKVHIEQEVIEITEGKGVHIPKGSMHKVYSDADTWALSIQSN